MAKIRVQAGAESIPVGKPVAILAEDAAGLSAFASYSSTQAEAAPGKASEPARAIVERPDLRPTKEQGVPMRNSRAKPLEENGTTDVYNAAPEGATLLTVRDALNSAMAEEMERDEAVFVIG